MGQFFVTLRAMEMLMSCCFMLLSLFCVLGFRGCVLAAVLRCAESCCGLVRRVPSSEELHGAAAKRVG